MNSDFPFIHRFQAMTVVCEVQIYGTADAQSVAAMIESNTRRLEEKYNFYSQSSWLNQVVNQRKTSTVTLDDESYTVFEGTKTCCKVNDINIVKSRYIEFL